MKFDLKKTEQLIEQQKGVIPPLDRWNPEFCGDINMRIARDGQWFYNGTPITRQSMVNLFSRVLWMEEDKYFLKTPVEKVGIQVDDAPFLIISISEREGENGKELCFTTATGDEVVAGKEHLIWVEVCEKTEEPSPYIDVRFGMRGLINRSVFYQLVDLAEEKRIDGKTAMVVTSQGERFELGVC